MTMTMHAHTNGISQASNIQFEIKKIIGFIEQEVADKRETIRQKDNQLNDLKVAVGLKDHSIAELEAKLKAHEHEAEGNRQLINKLLGDISKLHNDIEWYKRTYEKRSFMGVIKEKLLRRSH